MHRTGIEPMSTAWKAAMLPLHQQCWEGLRSKRWISELSNWDFSWQIFWVSHQKKTKTILWEADSFFANQTPLFLKIESCRFWFVTSQGLWKFKKRQEFTISWVFCPSNAHHSNVQSFPEIKYSFTALLNLCIVRESIPCQQLGRLLCYHYTNYAEKVYDRRDEFQNFQSWIFPYTFSKCHGKKKPKKFCEKRSKFFANQTNLFSLIESCCCFWFVTSKGQWEFKKRQEFTISWYFVPLTHTIVMLNLSLKLNILLPHDWIYASYGNRTHVNSLEGCYATTTPTMLRRFTIEEMNLRTFKLGIFLTNILSVTSEKTNTILWEAE